MARTIQQALYPPSISSGLVLGIEGLPGVRVNHTSSSPYRLLHCASSHFCSKRPWSLFLGFFVVLTILAPLLPFLFGRVMVIETYIRVRGMACLFLLFPNR